MGRVTLKQLLLGSSLKRFSAIVAGLLLVVVSLTGCSAGSSIVINSHVTIGQVGKITTLNSDVAESASNNIAGDLSALTLQGFYEIGADGSLVANETFGEVKITKQEPFTVSYELAKTALWSDGSSVDSTDLALAVTAAKLPAFKSVRFGSSLGNATIVGTLKPGGNSLVLSFPNPIADWRTAVQISAPAHVVGKAAGLSGNVGTLRAGILSAISAKDTELLKKLAAAYSSAFTTGGDPTNFVSNGAYTISKVDADSIELKAVRDFTGTHSAIAETVYFKTYPDNASAFKAVAAEEVDLFSPLATLNEPQSDLITSAQSLDTEIFTVLAQTSSRSEQFLLNLGGGTFADASYKKPDTAATLRKAFMNIVPKARAYDFASLTQVITRSDSFVYSSASKNYAAVAGSNLSADYLLQDVERASELIAGLKLFYQPVVKILFDTDNQAAVAEWTLLSDNSTSAGFRLTNISSDDPSALYKKGDYDVYLGDFPLLGVGAGSVQQLLNGPNRMPAEQFLGLTAGVVSASEKDLDAKLQELDQKLFEIGIGLPMYQSPTLLVHNQRIQGLVADPTATTSTWGYWTWKVSADK